MRSRPKKKFKGERNPRVAGLVSSWAGSDVGMKREKNEDSFFADSNLMTYVVADGMGGHAAGEMASQLAVEVLRQTVREARGSTSALRLASDKRESPEILQFLQEAVSAASHRIKETANANPALEGMGTTVTMMLFSGARGYVGHVGDSRLYRMRNGKVDQLTEDHSLVNEQIKAGFITPEEAQFSRYRNIITRSVGFESDVQADTFSVIAQPGDIFLLCSDGLTGMVLDDELGEVLNKTPLEDAVPELIHRANRHGGDDNITVVLLQYKGLGSRRSIGSKRKKRL
ncbi:MAG: Stp1/IreP family PP2C-type Ser/Thr phosphatase [Deltaproteobacteria bacterium]|nr:Stp1/IreP family PP2C-type Ser/Thr phosphatase [Deltaproteobacteria bacterium]